MELRNFGISHQRTVIKNQEGMSKARERGANDGENFYYDVASTSSMIQDFTVIILF